MKITDVEAIHLRLPEVAEIADGTQDVLVVKVHTDAGLTGIGEVTSQSYVCKAIIEAPRSAERRHGLAHILRGQDPLDVEGLWQRMYYHTNRYGRRGAAVHAISGVDIALWDIRGKALDRPVYELLGGAHRRDVRAYASYLFGSDPRQTAELAQQAVDLGLTAVKFGWGGFGKDEASDLAHVEAARRAVGDDRDLMVDAGQCWDAATALRRAQRLVPYGIAWLEEPLSQDDLAGYAELCPEAPLPIAAGEGGVTLLGLRGPGPLRPARPPARRRLLRRSDRLPRGLPDRPGGRPAVGPPLLQHRHQPRRLAPLDGLLPRRATSSSTVSGPPP